MLAPSSGGAVLGLDPYDPTERTDVRRRLGYLPQEMGFPRGFTAFRFVDYMAVLKEWTERDARHDEVRRVLDLVGLPTWRPSGCGRCPAVSADAPRWPRH